MSKFVIYQVIPRLFGNYNPTRKYRGTIEENGCGKFSSFTPKAFEEIKALGATHIWYTGILEHATKTDYSAYGIKTDHPGVVKGNAGSPYAIKDFYDVDPDLADDVNNRMNEFEELIERTHKAGLKAIIDFVPNHTARQYHSDAKPAGVKDLGEDDNTHHTFSPQNNYYYIPETAFTPYFNDEGYQEFPAKATGNDQFTPSPTEFDWYETVKLNYGINYTEGYQKHFDPIPDTWFKMADILCYWTAKQVDGFRVDMAEMVPVEFWGWAIPLVKKINPNIIFIAEVYQPSEYRNYLCNGKFDYLYDKVGMYEKLRGIISRNEPARDITAQWQNLNGIEDRMLNFLENHDEHRIASGFFCGSGIYAQPAMIVSATLTTSPVMIYMGQELGELGMDMEGFSGVDGKTSIFDYWGISSLQAWANNGKFDGANLNEEQTELRSFYKKLLHISMNQKAITEGLMYDLEYANFGNPNYNSHEQFSYFRKHKKELLLCIVNFQDKEQEIDINIPSEAFQYLDMEEGDYYSSTNLLNEKEEFPIQRLTSQYPYRIFLPAWHGKILNLKKEKIS
ncbi:MAG: alpha amylase catalytic region [Bacteroidetes bacterium]|nr:alpha amylase catalytic region [Bacteroidota bacterium]